MSNSLPLTKTHQWPARLDRLRWLHAALILLAVFVAANWRLIAGQVYEKWDAFDLATPYYSLLADYARAGKFLYWNPWLAGGSPDFAVAGSGTFSPDMLLAAMLTGPGGEAYIVYWLFTWLLGGLGMLCLARQLRAPVWGGLVVALGFTFSGYYTGHAEHNSVLYSYSLLPFIIWRLDAAIMRRRFLPAVQAGALWGLSALAGYPALTFYTVALIVAWAVGRTFFAAEVERAKNWRFPLLAVVLVGAVGLAVLSPSYFSAAYEGRGYSDRSGPLTRDFALNSNPLQPGAVATLSSPALIGITLDELTRRHRTLWAATDVSSLNLYTGSVTLLLALIAVAGVTQRRWRWYLLSVALLALACAISEALPFRGWLYDLVPPTRYFRHSSMLRGYFLFLLSVLALFGTIDLNRWRSDPATAKRFSLVAIFLSITAVGVFAWVRVIAEGEQLEPILAFGHLLLIWGGLIALAWVVRNRDAALTTVVPASLVAIALIDGLFAHHFSEGTLYEAGVRPDLPRPASSSVDLGASSFGRGAGTGRANINFLFKIPTLNNYAPFKNRFHEAIVADPRLARMALGDKRTWFIPEAPELAPTQEVFKQFAHRTIELEAPIIVVHSRESMLEGVTSSTTSDVSLGATPAAVNVPAAIIEYRPEKLVLDVNVPSDGWLMNTDRWSRSWSATVNGSPQPVLCANFIFRAVRVVKGDNRVEFSFNPVGLPGLIILSWGLLALIALATVMAVFRPRANLGTHLAARFRNE